MRWLYVVLVTSLMGVGAHHFIFGDLTKGLVLIKEDEVRYGFYPFSGREENYTYVAPLGSKFKIQAIQAVDRLKSDSNVTVEEGGVGHSSVRLKLVSSPWSRLDYKIGIYTKPAF